MNNTLYLRKMGLDFDDDKDDRQKKSNVGNFRVRTEGNSITTKSGRKMFMEFCMANKWDTTGKKPVLETDYGLAVDTEYTECRINDGGVTYTTTVRDLAYETEIRERSLYYTLEDILIAVNTISEIQYDNIEFLN